MTQAPEKLPTTLNGPLERLGEVFESQTQDAVFIVPAMFKNRETQLLARIVALSNHCGIIGRALYNPEKRTRMQLLAETDVIYSVYGNAFCLHPNYYMNPNRVQRLCLQATDYGKHKAYEFSREGETCHKP